MTRKSSLTILSIITAIGVGLRSIHLTSRSLWFDEAFSWRLIQFPFSEMITRAAADVHPPLYYILLRVWHGVFESSLLSLRSFSVFFAALTILAAYLFVSYAFRSRSLGLFAAGLIAISGFQIQFAWEARMYTLGTFLVLLSSYLLIRAIRHPNLINWLIYAVCGAAFAYTHYFSFFSIAAQLFFVIGFILIHTKGRPGEIIQWPVTWYSFIAFLVMLLSYIPWLPTFFKQNSQVQDNFWIPSIGGWSIPDTFYRMFAPTSGIPAHSGFFWILLTATPISLVILGWLLLVIWKIHRNTDLTAPAWLVMLAGSIPFLITIVISFIGQSIYQDRFFVFAHLFILIGLSILLSRLRPIWLRGTAMVGIITLLIYTSLSYWIELDIPNKPGAAAAGQDISDNIRTGEQVIVSSPFVFFTIDHYAKEKYDRLYLPKLFSETGELLHFAGGPILSPEDIAGPSTLTDSNILWIVDTTGFGGSALPLSSEWQSTFHSSYPEVFSHQGEVMVTRYERSR